jgi:hypothetical protein
MRVILKEQLLSIRMDPPYDRTARAMQLLAQGGSLTKDLGLSLFRC